MDGGRYRGYQILKPETVAAMQKIQSAKDGTPLGFGLSWILGEDDFGKFYNHSGGGPTIETIMRSYPDLDLGVVVMCSVNGCQADGIAEGVASAWTHENDLSSSMQGSEEPTACASRKPRPTMKNTQPIYDPTTHYRIEVQGLVDVEWLQSFDSSAEITLDEARQAEATTVLNVHTDQSGIVGLVRRLHGLGMTILQLEIISDEGKLPSTSASIAW